MSLLRIAAERLFLVLFWIARSMFLAQGLAMGSALLAASWSGRPDAPPWLETVVRSCLILGATFLATGVLLYAARHGLAPPMRGAVQTAVAPGVEGDARPSWSWRLLLGLSLAGLPALAYAETSELVALWGEILDLLHRIGFWDELQRPGPFSGLVMIPLLVALFVPVLEAATAFFLIAVPLGLVALLLARSRLFPTIFVMTVVCQAGLVAGSLLAADGFARLATEASVAMTSSGDAEVLRLAEDLHRAQSVLTATAAGFVTPMLGYLVWLPALLLSQRLGAFFTAVAVVAPTPSRVATPREPVVFRPVPSGSARSAGGAETPRTAKPAEVRDRRARVALVTLGSLMLVFAACESLRPLARCVSSEPAPGSTLTSPPAAVRVSFGRALDPSSSISVTRTIAHPAAELATSSGLDPDDPQRSTLKAELPATSGGLYRVDWRSLPASGGVPGYGTFHFGVGMPVPESVAGDGPPLRERDAGQRGRRNTVAGGALLITLGALLPRLPRSR
jgi:methionine-rich copper-binding protein CopC